MEARVSLPNSAWTPPATRNESGLRPTSKSMPIRTSLNLTLPLGSMAFILVFSDLVEYFSLERIDSDVGRLPKVR
jgi:hypothetical protein